MLSGSVTCDGAVISDIVVSDGLHVTRTDDAGRFELPGAGPFVFLCRPTDFACERWYLPASGSLDFALSRQSQPVPFTFAQVSDLHLSLGDPSYGEGQGDATVWLDEDGVHDRIVTTPAVLGALLEELRGLSFVVATGDLTNNGTPAELAAYSSSLASSPVTVVSIPGNHDHHSAAPPAFPYEDSLGPRWFSFDFAGMHFAAIDWFTWRLRVDHEEQEAWLSADLGAVPLGTPVVLLTHDQMPSDFYDRLPLRPVASFSGHWHTTRVVEHAGTVHYNTGTATFGGLDYSPAHYRLATWDGSRLDVRTVVRGPSALGGATMRSSAGVAGPVRWSRALSGGAHLSGPVVVGDRVLAVSRSEDRPGGSLECFAVEDGRPVWSVLLSAAVKAEPLVVGDRVVVSSVSGETVCVSLDGIVQWRTQVDDPLRPWVHLRPATDGTRVFVGDVGCFAALSLSDGSLVWSRDDLGQRENLTSFSHPLVAGERLLVGFAGQQPALWALDPLSGATVWPAIDRGRSIYSGGDLATHLPRVVVSGLTADPSSDDVYLVRLGASLERVSTATGELVWAAPFSGWFNPAAPVVWGDLVLATEGSGRLFCFGRDGAHHWTTSLCSAAPLAMGSYRADGGVALAPPTVVDDRALIPTGDGRVLALSRDGSIVAELPVGIPVTGRLALADGALLLVGVDGVLRALDTNSLLP